MGSVSVVLRAKDQDRLIDKVVEGILSITSSYITIVDSPSQKVSSAIKSSSHIYKFPNPNNQFNQLLSMKYVENIIKNHNFRNKWILLVDGDEVWNKEILNEIKKAETMSCNVINFAIQNHHPLLKKWNGIGDIFKYTTTFGCGYYHSINIFQRSWVNDPSFTFFPNNGPWVHTIGINNKRVYNSDYKFQHFYALDFEELEMKRKRKRDIDNKTYKANTQYNISR